MESYAFPALEGGRVGAGATVAERAALIVEQAHAEAAAVAAAAAERGRQEGYAAGLAEAREALEPTRAALLSVVAALEGAVDDFLLAAERRAVDLALALADKVVHAALEVDPELVRSVALGALRRLAERDEVVLEVNPADVELVQAGLREIEAQLGGFRRLEVVGERRVERGGCVVRTREGEVDAGIDEQLGRAAELLRESLAAER